MEIDELGRLLIALFLFLRCSRPVAALVTIRQNGAGLPRAPTSQARLGRPAKSGA